MRGGGEVPTMGRKCEGQKWEPENLLWEFLPDHGRSPFPSTHGAVCAAPNGSVFSGPGALFPQTMCAGWPHSDKGSIGQ